VDAIEDDGEGASQHDQEMGSPVLVLGRERPDEAVDAAQFFAAAASKNSTHQTLLLLSAQVGSVRSSGISRRR
jgi:hypothetical protein